MSTSIPFEAPWGRRRRPQRHSPPWDREQPGRADQGAAGSDDPAADRPRGRGRPGRGRGHGRHFGPFGGDPAFGFGFGPGGFGPRGSRARRGDVRAAILALLAEEPMHGYQLIQEISRRSDGMWRPSAGSVYPALSLLQDEGLVRPEGGADEEGARKVFALTDAGRAYVADHAEDLANPWDTVTGGGTRGAGEIMDLVRQVGFATLQVLRTGDSASTEAARRILDQARRALYLVLAGEPPTAGEPGPGAESGPQA